MAYTTTTYRLQQGAPSSADNFGQQELADHQQQQPIPHDLKNRLVHLFLKPGLYDSSDTDEDSEEEMNRPARRRSRTVAERSSKPHASQGLPGYRELHVGGIGESPLNWQARHKQTGSGATNNSHTNSSQSHLNLSRHRHNRMASEDTHATSISNYSIPPVMSANDRGRTSMQSKRLTPLSYNSPALSGRSTFEGDGTNARQLYRLSLTDSGGKMRQSKSLVAQLGEIPLHSQNPVPSENQPLFRSLPSPVPNGGIPHVIISPETPKTSRKTSNRPQLGRPKSSSVSDLRKAAAQQGQLDNPALNTSRRVQPRPVHYAVEGSSRIQPIILTRPTLQGRFSYDSATRRESLIEDAQTRFRQSFESDGASARQILRDMQAQRKEREGWQTNGGGAFAHRKRKPRSRSNETAADIRQRSRPIGVQRLGPEGSPQISSSFQLCDSSRRGQQRRKRRNSVTICDRIRSRRRGKGSQSRDMGVQTDDEDLFRSATPRAFPVAPRPRVTSNNAVQQPVSRPSVPTRRRSSSFGGISSTPLLYGQSMRPLASKSEHLRISDRAVSPEQRYISPMEVQRRRSRRMSAHRYRFAPHPITVPQSKIDQGQAFDVPKSPSQPIHRISGDSQLSADWEALAPMIDVQPQADGCDQSNNSLTVQQPLQRKVSDESANTAAHSRVSSESDHEEQFANLFFRPPQLDRAKFGKANVEASNQMIETPTTASKRLSLDSGSSAYPTLLTSATTIGPISRLSNVAEDGKDLYIDEPMSSKRSSLSQAPNSMRLHSGTMRSPSYVQQFSWNDQQSHKSMVIDFGSSDEEGPQAQQLRPLSMALSQTSYIDLDHSPERPLAIAKVMDGAKEPVESDSKEDERNSFLDFSPPSSPLAVPPRPLMLTAVSPIQTTSSPNLSSASPNPSSASKHLSAQDIVFNNARASVMTASVVHSPLPGLDSFPLPPDDIGESSDDFEARPRPTLRPKLSHASTGHSTVADWISVYTHPREGLSSRSVLDASVENYETPMASQSWLSLSPERSERVQNSSIGDDSDVERSWSGTLASFQPPNIPDLRANSDESGHIEGRFKSDEGDSH